MPSTMSTISHPQLPILNHFTTAIFTSSALLVLLYRYFSSSSRRHSKTAHIHDLSGLKSDSFLFGNTRFLDNLPNRPEIDLFEQYGSDVISVHGPLSKRAAWTCDPKLIAHTMNDMDFFRGPLASKQLRWVLGEGVLAVEGETHKRMRKIMGPAFASTQIRQLVLIFLEKARILTEVWTEQLTEHSITSSSPFEVDAYHGLGCASLDVIGSAGFGYEFDTLTKQRADGLSKSVTLLLNQTRITFSRLVQLFVPGLLGRLPTRDTTDLIASKKIIYQVSERLYSERLQEIQDDPLARKEQLIGKDLLTVLIKSNLLSQKDGSKMSTHEVLSQIATFVLTGHETTGTALTWGLYELARNPDIQHRLREELFSATFDTDSPSMDELNELTYLDWVVKEILRVHPGVPLVIRQATKDILLPASKAFKDRNGVERDSLLIQKDEMICFPLFALNRRKAYWGEDANTFRPERWEHPMDSSNMNPSLYSNLSTFFAGAHGCMGWRFAVVEMKAFLFQMVRTFHFEPVPEVEIVKNTKMVTRPTVVGDDGFGKMPLRISLVSR